MTWLLELPNELLILILGLLDNHDINNLHAIPQFKTRMKNLICLISDVYPPSEFPNITQSASLNDYYSIERLQGTFQAVVELHDFVEASTYQMLAVQNATSAVTVSLFTKAKKLVMTESECFLFRFFREGVQSATFENLTDITFRGVCIDSGKLRFPYVKELALQDVWIENPGKKLLLPSLVELSVDGIFGDINASLDYEQLTNLKRLTLNDISDMTFWKGVHCPTLQHIEIDGCSFTTFQDLNFDNLKVFTIDRTDVEKFLFMSLPLLRILVIFNSEANTSIHDIYAPQLKSFFIRTNTIEECYNVNAPLLTDADFGHIHGELSLSENEKIDTSIFNGLETVKIEGCSEILEHTPLLRSLTVSSPLFFNTNYRLPNLSDLTIGTHCANHLHDFPKSIFHNLRVLRLSDSCMSDEIDYIQSLSPNLKELIFDDHTTNKLFHKCIKGIEKLEVHSFGQMESYTLTDIHIHNCNFPDLKEFHASYDCINGPYFPSELNFSASNLEKVVIKGLDIPHLDLSGFPKLREVSITGGIRKITMCECQFLETLNLCDKCEVIHVEPLIPSISPALEAILC